MPHPRTIAPTAATTRTTSPVAPPRFTLFPPLSRYGSCAADPAPDSDYYTSDTASRHHAGQVRTVLDLRCQFPFFQAQSFTLLAPSCFRLAFPSVPSPQKQVRLSSFWVRFWGLLTHNPFICNKSLGSFPLNNFFSLLLTLACHILRHPIRDALGPSSLPRGPSRNPSSPAASLST